jgi:hypothetical protein
MSLGRLLSVEDLFVGVQVRLEPAMMFAEGMTVFD